MSTETSQSKRSGLDRTIAQLVRSYHRRLQPVPGPQETFLKRDLPPETTELFHRFWENDLFEQVEYDDDLEAYRWRLRPTVHDAIQRFSAPRSNGTRVTPCCQYQGFSNLREGGFECRLCHEEFDEFAVVEEGDDGD